MESFEAERELGTLQVQSTVGTCVIITNRCIIIGHFLPSNFERVTYAMLQSEQMNKQ